MKNYFYLIKQIKKAVKIISLLLIPAILFTILFGQYILLLFGREYAVEGFRFLQLISLSGIFVGINAVFVSTFKVQKRVKEIFIKSIIGTFVILILAYLLISKEGLLGVAYAWVIGQFVMNIVFTLMWKFNKNKK